MRGTACRYLGDRWFFAFAKRKRLIPFEPKNINISKFQPAVLAFNIRTFKGETAERIIDFYSWHNRMIITFARPDGTAANGGNIEEILGELKRSAPSTVLGIEVIPANKEGLAEIKNALFHGKIVVAVSPQGTPQNIGTFTSQLRRQFKGKNISL